MCHSLKHQEYPRVQAQYQRLNQSLLTGTFYIGNSVSLPSFSYHSRKYTFMQCTGFCGKQQNEMLLACLQRNLKKENHQGGRTKGSHSHFACWPFSLPSFSPQKEKIVIWSGSRTFLGPHLMIGMIALELLRDSVFHCKWDNWYTKPRSIPLATFLLLVLSFYVGNSRLLVICFSSHSME
jgi:hypothetical protein